MLIISNGEYVLLWAGDSRAYLGLNKKICVLTKDDVWENNPQNVSGLSSDEILKDKRFGKLTNAIGAKPSVDVHNITGSLVKKGFFLLCSDGMYKFCSDKKINQYMKKNSFFWSTERILKKWKKIINKNGAKDNYSIILFEIFLDDKKEAKQ